MPPRLPRRRAQSPATAPSALCPRASAGRMAALDRRLRICWERAPSLIGSIAHVRPRRRLPVMPTGRQDQSLRAWSGNPSPGASCWPAAFRETSIWLWSTKRAQACPSLLKARIARAEAIGSDDGRRSRTAPPGADLGALRSCADPLAEPPPQPSAFERRIQPLPGLRPSPRQRSLLRLSLTP